MFPHNHLAPCPAKAQTKSRNDTTDNFNLLSLHAKNRAQAHSISDYLLHALLGNSQFPYNLKIRLHLSPLSQGRLWNEIYQLNRYPEEAVPRQVIRQLFFRFTDRDSHTTRRLLPSSSGWRVGIAYLVEEYVFLDHKQNTCGMGDKSHSRSWLADQEYSSVSAFMQAREDEKVKSRLQNVLY